MRCLPVLFLFCSVAAASPNWGDRENGCGSGAAFASSGKVADLPGCSGRLPKDPPQVETVLHDAKRLLADVEEWLDNGKLDKLAKVDALLETVERSLAKTPPVHPELPDRWDAAQPLYARAVAALRQRRRLAPSLDKVRVAYRAAVESGKKLQTDPISALKTAQACVAAFAEPRTAGVSLALWAEMEKGHARALGDVLAECERQAKAAGPLLRAREKAAALAAAKAQRDARSLQRAKARAKRR